MVMEREVDNISLAMSYHNIQCGLETPNRYLVLVSGVANGHRPKLFKHLLWLVVAQ